MRDSYEIQVELQALQEVQRQNKARKLIKYIKRTGKHKGELVDLTPRQYKEITGKAPRPSIINSKTKKVPWHLALDIIASERGYRSDEELKYAIEEALENERRITQLKKELSYARTKEAEGVKCDPTFRTKEACVKPVHGDWCKAKVKQCDGLEIVAVRHPSSWSIHMVRSGQSPSGANKAGEVRYAHGAKRVINKVAGGLEAKSKQTVKAKSKTKGRKRKK